MNGIVQKEIWKQIEGHQNHFVSNLGRIKSIDHVVLDKGRPSHRKGRIFKLTPSGNGYVRVYVEGHCYSLHRLIAGAFITHDKNHNVVNHIDGCKTNNRLDNLEWVTKSENGKHAYKNGLNVMSKERREKIAKSHLGMKASEETRLKIKQNHHHGGYTHSAETKKKISESITQWHKKNEKNKIDI